MNKPGVFVGSASDAEGTAVANAIQANLYDECEVVLWSQGFFGLMEGTLEKLVAELPRYDFAVFALTADDLIESHGQRSAAPRDNVLFELGLSVGLLGRDRTFAVLNREARVKVPSDFAGITLAAFDPPNLGSYEAALGPACAKILKTIKGLGCRPKRDLRASAQELPIDGSPSSLTQGQSAENCLAPWRMCDDARRICESVSSHCRDTEKWESRTDLFILLFRINDQARCVLARELLLGRFPTCKILEVYDLYGPRDLLVKVHAKDIVTVRHEVIKRLGRNGLLGQAVVVDVADEEPVEYEQDPEIIPVREEYLTSCASLRGELRAGRGSRGIKAFVDISGFTKANPGTARAHRAGRALATLCINVAKGFPVAQAGPSRAILTAVWRGDSNVIAEYYLPCGGYYQLADVIIAIEQGISPELGASRETLLTMSAWPDEVLTLGTTA